MKRNDEMMPRSDLDPDVVGVLMIPIPEEGITDWARPYIERAGSVCLFSQNTAGGFAATRTLVEQIRELNPTVVVASDEEGGDVTRIEAALGSSLPNAAVVSDAFTTGKFLGELCACVGVDLDLAPVADVLTEKHNPVISVRSFSSSQTDVVTKCRELIHGLHSRGRTACIKHYPGHGASTNDSHVDSVQIPLSASSYLEHHVHAFHELVGDTDAVMMGHLEIPALGAGVSSVSSWSYSALRSAGFDGAVITDALDMSGAGRSQDSRLSDFAYRCYKAVESGADLLCLGAPKRARDLLRDGYLGVATALADGVITRADLRNRRARIERLRGTAGYYSYDRSQALAFGIAQVEKQVWSRGITQVEGAWVLVDARKVPEYSAAFLAPAIVRVAADLGGKYIGAAESLFSDCHAEASSSPEATRVCVLTKSPFCEEEDAAIRKVARAYPDALFIHLGTADTAPAVPNMICLQGTSAAHAQVLKKLMHPAHFER
ncbi:MAG: glycoside hydrolase family 3 N-terminal domain-containing protein [Arcanobacterium sp.]|nr:glycoside hydrolase family 3 N-terminal domain-containing protein [Arcanobacterium sp.]